MTDLIALLSMAKTITAFTGAGISTDSGVPDFRSPGSPWLANKPIDFADFLRDPALRCEGWRRKFAMDDLYAGAKPSIGHLALAELARAGRLAGVITQNIDGLHQASGVPPEKIAELHGNGTFATCLSCGLRHELATIRAEFDETGIARACRCGGLVKSATISFGQPVPQPALRLAGGWALACELFLVLGSSLKVRPAASLPEVAKRHGAKLVIVNREPTPLDDLADHVFHGEIGQLLAPLAH